MSFRYIALFYKKKVPALDIFLFFAQHPITYLKTYTNVLLLKNTPLFIGDIPPPPQMMAHWENQSSVPHHFPPARRVHLAHS